MSVAGLLVLGFVGLVLVLVGLSGQFARFRGVTGAPGGGGDVPPPDPTGALGAESAQGVPGPAEGPAGGSRGAGAWVRPRAALAQRARREQERSSAASGSLAIDTGLLIVLFDTYLELPERASQLRAQIEEQLRRHGGELFRPKDLCPWQPDVHDAVREVPTALPERNERVAWAEGPGMRSVADGSVLRPARVARYRFS